MEFIDLRHCCLNDQCAAIMARSFKLNTTLRILHLEGDNLSGKLLLILCKWQFLRGEGGSFDSIHKFQHLCVHEISASMCT